jgi:branched-chain amino acid transport system ATP-binding protein
MKAVELKNLCKSFGGLQAVKNLSLSIEKGERHAIIGPNGAGKTTLLNLIAGLFPCDEGEIRLFGRDITNLSDSRRVEFGLARTFQLTSIFLDLSVMDNILLATQAVKPYHFQIFQYQEAYKDLFEESSVLLEKWSLWDKRETIARELSYGDQRKVELIMGLASRPRILLLDEPTCGLTIDESAYFSDLIRDLGKDITLVIVEHDMDIVFNIASRISVLHYGSLLVEGTPQEISENPKAREVYLGIKE